MAIQIPVIDAIFKVVDKLIPDPEARARAKLEVLKLEQEGEFKQLDADLRVMLAQADINKADAQSNDAFRGGWRPAVGWVCVTGLAYNYVAHPLLAWYSVAHTIPVPPTLDIYDLMILLGGMLGFGGMRSFERIRGKA